MRFDIVPPNKFYSGIGRSLTTSDLLTRESKRYFKNLLNIYFDYLDLIYNFDHDEKLFYHILDLYRQFRNYNVSCEIIAYDNAPIDAIWGTSFEFLGIDVTQDLAESLLEDFDNININIRKYLNDYGLLEKPNDIDIVLNNSITGGMIWEPCWVYKVMV